MPRTDEHSRILTVTALAVAAACALGVACSDTPSGPQEGTPEWYLQAAVDNFAVPEYVKTVEHLKEAMKSEGEIGQKALLWRAALTAGLARGYDELADAFVEGIENNDARTEDYQNLVNDYRRRTRVNAIEFSESAGQIKAVTDAQEIVPLNFPLPEGNGSPSTVLSTVRAGNKVEAELVAMEDQTLTWGIFSALSDLTGGTEASKLIADAEAGGVQVPSDTLAFGVARVLLDVSVMFDREGINDPRVRAFVLNMAVEWGEPHLDNEEFGDRVDEFKFDLENERRDFARKRRIKRGDS